MAAAAAGVFLPDMEEADLRDHKDSTKWIEVAAEGTVDGKGKDRYRKQERASC